MPPEIRDRVSLRELAASFVEGAARIIRGSNIQGDSRRIQQPGVPLTPALEQGNEPRWWEVRAGRNLGITPRSEDLRLTPFKTLRALADSHGATKAVIQSIRSTILGAEWDIVARDEFAEQSDAMRSDTTAIRKFFERPDGVTPWDLWLSKLIDEILVIDALTLVPRTDLLGRPAALEVIDGATIKPIVNVLGQLPDPPDPAFQQIIAGRPETEFTRDEILYRPKNARAWTPYGQPPIEMVAVTINLAVRRELHFLEFYVSGNLPDSLLLAPEKWTDEQIRKFQVYLDDSMGGESGRRSGALRVVPGGPDVKIVPTKDETFAYEFDEYINRVIAYAFGVSPLWVAKQVNRATAGKMDDRENGAAIEPIKRFIAARINEYITLYLDEPRLMFAWQEAREENEELKLSEDRTLIPLGARTIDEARKARGEEPLPDGVGSRAFVMGPSGPVFIDDVVRASIAAQEASTKQKTASIDPSLIQRAFLEVPIIRRDELRATLGLPPVGGPEGDEFITIAGIQPGDDEGEENQTPEGREGFAQAERTQGRSDQTSDSGPDALTDAATKPSGTAASETEREQEFARLRKVLSRDPSRRFISEIISPDEIESVRKRTKSPAATLTRATKGMQRAVKRALDLNRPIFEEWAQRELAARRRDAEGQKP